MALDARLQMETNQSFQLSRSHSQVLDERLMEELAHATVDTLKQQHHISYKTDALQHFGTQFLRVLESL